MSDKASIQYCGHATVIINSEQGKKIIIDPWLEGNPKCPENLFDQNDVDYIILTHGHADHTASAADLAIASKATVFATYELANLMIKDGVDQSQLQHMNKGGTVEIPDSGGIKVSLTHAQHSSSYDAKDGNTYYAGEACGVVVTLESGRTVYHAGDTSLFRDMKAIGKHFKPTLALLPIGDRFTMDPKAAAHAVSLIKPKIAMPVHFATFPPLTGTPEEFSKHCESLETDVLVLEPGEIKNF